ncbi:putative cactin-like isoform X4 [Sesbania bispinosa]|nr:putative cactin-like isoform X4 [Sesbania bispinosa]
MASRPTPSEDNFEMKAMKAMGAMEDGDAMFGLVRLVDKTKAPTYTIEKDGSNGETWPPYEDIV